MGLELPMNLEKRGRNRLVGVAGSVVAHLSIFLALVWARPDPPRAPEPVPIVVTLVDERTPTPPVPPAPAPTPAAPRAPQAAAAAAQPSPAEPVPAPRIARIVAAPADVAPLAAGEAKAVGSSDGVSEAELAGAASADAGPPGGACDMARWLQRALRKDPLVQAAVAARPAGGSAGNAIRVWNGDWVQTGGEDGKGLAAVREAIMWEVAFAPPACRAEPVRGLVLISLNTGPGAARLALGSSAWRWSDLLGASRR